MKRQEEIQTEAAQAQEDRREQNIARRVTANFIQRGTENTLKTQTIGAMEKLEKISERGRSEEIEVIRDKLISKNE